jgi:chromosome segregation ATPase
METQILQQIFDKLDKLEQGQSKLEQGQSKLEQGQSKMQSDINGLKSEVSETNMNIKYLWGDIKRLDRHLEEHIEALHNYD